MYIPFDEEQRIHPQDAEFLDLEPWDWDGTPDEKYPLLLHYHPLVIYRHQVLKQADVVLAMFLRSEQFDVDQMRRNFDYYDPITTGDSSLSACVQSIVAAMVGYEDLAVDYFKRALYLDLCDAHGNTVDGVHIASAGGVWAGVVNGFAGMTEHGDRLRFAPRLPKPVGPGHVPHHPPRLPHAGRSRPRRLHPHPRRRHRRADRHRRRGGGRRRR